MYTVILGSRTLLKTNDYLKANQIMQSAPGSFIVHKNLPASIKMDFIRMAL